jgi:hypothetical protein
MPDIKILQLRERQERRCDDDVHAEEMEARVVEEEGVLEGEECVFVGVHDAGVFDDVDVFRRPASGNVGDYDLL